MFVIKLGYKLNYFLLLIAVIFNLRKNNGYQRLSLFLSFKSMHIMSLFFNRFVNSCLYDLYMVFHGRFVMFFTNDYSKIYVYGIPLFSILI